MLLAEIKAYLYVSVLMTNTSYGKQHNDSAYIVSLIFEMPKRSYDSALKMYVVSEYFHTSEPAVTKEPCWRVG